MRAFVISLPRRADRLASFGEHMKTTGLDRRFTIETIPAVDGLTLNLDEIMPRVASLTQREHARSADKLPERELRGILGCALSHLEAWNRVLTLAEPAVVFEDDARLSAAVDAGMVQSALETLPRDADLCWLNDCHYDARGGLRFRLRRKLAGVVGALPPPRKVRFSPMPDMMVATDAYIVTPSFARRLREKLEHHVGAIDRHMQVFVSQSKARVYQTYPALFTTDFTDSDTSPRQANS